MNMVSLTDYHKKPYSGCTQASGMLNMYIYIYIYIYVMAIYGFSIISRRVWQLIGVRRAEFDRCRFHVIERKHSLSVAKVSLSRERKKPRIRVIDAALK